MYGIQGRVGPRKVTPQQHKELSQERAGRGKVRQRKREKERKRKLSPVMPIVTSAS